MDNLLTFFKESRKLKEIKRKGWVLRGIKNPESVADHSFSTAMISFILAKEIGLDQNKCIKISLIHDLAEVYSGDITPHDNIPKDIKHNIEMDSMKKLCSALEEKEIIGLWEEYEENKTEESKFVHEVDKIEMLIQALDYETRFNDKKEEINEFWVNTKDQIKIKELKNLVKILEKERANII